MRWNLAVFSIAAGLSSHAAAQSFSGSYQFVYAVWQRGSAFAVMGSAVFDGVGKYTFQGIQRSTGHSASVTGTGEYTLQPDFTGSISNPLDPLMPPLQLRVSADLDTLGASTIDYNSTYQHDLWVAVRASTGKTAADLSGSWGGVANYYSPAPVVFCFNLMARGRFHRKTGVGMRATKTTAPSSSLPQPGPTPWPLMEPVPTPPRLGQSVSPSLPMGCLLSGLMMPMDKN